MKLRLKRKMAFLLWRKDLINVVDKFDIMAAAASDSAKTTRRLSECINSEANKRLMESIRHSWNNRRIH